MRPLYIFDLDGTLSLNEWRTHLLPDWKAFFAASKYDAPNLPVIRTLQSLRRAGGEIWIWSGRSDEVRADTEEWLYKHGCLRTTMFLHWEPFIPFESFRMRKAGDFTPDEQLKYGWLSEMEPPERNRLTAVFDDRDKVVKMWRDAGVPCFQVASGNF